MPDPENRAPQPVAPLRFARSAAAPAVPERWESEVFIALGSNLGDRSATLSSAVRELTQLPDLAVLAASHIYETDPVGGPAGQPRYLNAVVRVATGRPPQELIGELQRIEAAHGRRRGEPNAPRTLDLDLLTYGLRILDTPRLTLPHPRMWERPFVCLPLSELTDVEELRRRIEAQRR